MGVVKAVCTSSIKGIQKTEQDAIELKSDWGVEGDAHGGPWHRQVSLLSYEQIEAFKARGADVGHGSFGENIVVEGFDLKSLPIGTRFTCGDVVLELTQVGKQCHAHCAIYHQVGDCIMPREGVFCKVIEGGAIAPSTTTPIGSCALQTTPPGSTSTSWRAFPNGPPTYSTRTPPCTDAPISSTRDCRKRIDFLQLLFG